MIVRTFFILLLFLVLSCKKEYQCECIGYKSLLFDVKARDEEDARYKCKQWEDSIYYNCVLK